MALQSDWHLIAPGMTVFDVYGEKLGHIRQIDPHGRYLRVQKGWLVIKDFSVPADAVERVIRDGIELNISKDDLEVEHEDGMLDTGTTAVPTLRAGDTGTVRRASQVTYTESDAGIRDTSQPGELDIPVYEEELVVGKRIQEEGRVRIHKEVVEEQQRITVPVRKERVTVERIPAGGPATAADDAFTKQDIEVPVRGEEAVVGKRLKEVEEVRLHKDVINETEVVGDTVRKERVVVDGVDASDTTSSSSNG